MWRKTIFNFIHDSDFDALNYRKRQREPFVTMVVFHKRTSNPIEYQKCESEFVFWNLLVLVLSSVMFRLLENSTFFFICPLCASELAIRSKNFWRNLKWGTFTFSRFWTACFDDIDGNTNKKWPSVSTGNSVISAKARPTIKNCFHDGWLHRNSLYNGRADVIRWTAPHYSLTACGELWLVFAAAAF